LFQRIDLSFIYDVPIKKKKKNRTFPVEEFYLENILEMIAHVIEKDSFYCKKPEYISQNEGVMEISSKGGNKS